MQTCQLKTIFKIKPKDIHKQKVEEKDSFKKFITPKNYVVRLYVLEGKQMTPHDSNGFSDPFLIIKLGDRKIVDRESLRKKTLNPEFFCSYEIPTTLPGSNSILTIEVWDDDGFLG